MNNDGVEKLIPLHPRKWTSSIFQNSSIEFQNSDSFLTGRKPLADKKKSMKTRKKEEHFHDTHLQFHGRNHRTAAVWLVNSCLPQSIDTASIIFVKKEQKMIENLNWWTVQVFLLATEFFFSEGPTRAHLGIHRRPATNWRGRSTWMLAFVVLGQLIGPPAVGPSSSFYWFALVAFSFLLFLSLSPSLSLASITSHALRFFFLKVAFNDSLLGSTEVLTSVDGFYWVLLSFTRVTFGVATELWRSSSSRCWFDWSVVRKKKERRCRLDFADDGPRGGVLLHFFFIKNIFPSTDQSKAVSRRLVDVFERKKERKEGKGRWAAAFFSRIFKVRAKPTEVTGAAAAVHLPCAAVDGRKRKKKPVVDVPLTVGFPYSRVTGEKPKKMFKKKKWKETNGRLLFFFLGESDGLV